MRLLGNHNHGLQKHMVRKLKAFKIIDLIVNINLDYLKKTVHNLFTTNIQGDVLKNKSSGTFKQNPWKIPKSNFFSKVNHLK